VPRTLPDTEAGQGQEATAAKREDEPLAPGINWVAGAHHVSSIIPLDIDEVVFLVKRRVEAEEAPGRGGGGGTADRFVDDSPLIRPGGGTRQSPRLYPQEKQNASSTEWG